MNEGDPWDKSYINMRETAKIFRSEPCFLPEERAELLARYVVEDVQEEFVWVHGAN